ncbi:MAG: ABC transporter ATP-binding protein [Sphingobium sp.]
MISRDALARWVFRLGYQTGPDRPLGELERRYIWSLPIAVFITLIGTVLDGLNIGLLVPLLSVMLSGETSEDMFAPLQYVLDLSRQWSPDNPLLFIGVMMLGIIILKNVVGVLGGLWLAKVDGHASADMRSMLAKRLLRLPYSFFLMEESPRLINTISSDSWRASEAMQAIYGIASSAAAALVLSGFALFANWKLFLIVMVGAVVARFLQARLAKTVKSYSERLTEANRQLGERMLLIIDLSRLIRLFNQEDQEQKAFDKSSDKVRQAMYDMERVSALYGPVMEFLLATLFIVVLIVANNMAMSVPEILAFLVLQYRLQPHVMAVNEGFLTLAGLSGSIGEVEYLLGPEDKPDAQGGGPLEGALDQPIRFDHVSYTFPYEEQPVIRDASFTIMPGMATALIGRSGAGKSTIINLLDRLLDPQQGQILIGDRPLRDIDPRDWRSRIALAGQDVDLVEGTVADNIAYRMEGLSRAEIEEAARLADADGFIRAMPGGFEARIDSYGMNLSGGQRQRIALARALVRKPDLLILDEATNAVDGLSENVIMTLLQEHRSFKTAIVISHRRSTLSACQQGVVIEDGRIIEAGPLRSLDFYKIMEVAEDADESPET